MNIFNTKYKEYDEINEMTPDKIYANALECMTDSPLTFRGTISVLEAQGFYNSRFYKSNDLYHELYDYLTKEQEQIGVIPVNLSDEQIIMKILQAIDKPCIFNIEDTAYELGQFMVYYLEETNESKITEKKLP